jgi:hypothetical protein
MPVSTATFTRPSNTNAYGAGDVVGATVAALTFAGIGQAGSDLMITSATLRIDLSAVPAGMTTFFLHLYSATPPSASADEATWDLPSGDRTTYLGSIALGTPVDVGSTLFIEATQINKQIHPVGRDLYGYLVTTAGYTAASATVYSVTLNAVVL